MAPDKKSDREPWPEPKHKKVRSRAVRRPAARAASVRTAKLRSSDRPVRTRRGSMELQQLNVLIDKLIKENRKLKRQVDKLTARESAVASSTVERGLRTIQRRVQRALAAPVKRPRKKTQAAGTIAGR